MSTKDKLKKRVLSIPSDLRYSEMKSFLTSIGYQESNKGATSGSRVGFILNEDKILFHKPHGTDQMKKGLIRKIVETLHEKNLLGAD